MVDYKARIVDIDSKEISRGREQQESQIEEMAYLLEAVTTEDEEMRAPGGNLHTCLEEIEALDKRISDIQELERRIKSLEKDIAINKRMIEQGIHRQSGPDAMLVADMRFNQVLAEAELRHYELLQPESSLDRLIEIRKEAIERKSIINRSIENLRDTIERLSKIHSTADADCFKLLIPKPASMSEEDLAEYRVYIKELMTKLDRMQRENPKAKGLYLTLYSRLEHQKALIDSSSAPIEDITAFVFKEDITLLKSLYDDDGLVIEALGARAHVIQGDLGYGNHDQIPEVVSMSFDSFIDARTPPSVTEMTLEEFLSGNMDHSTASSPEPAEDDLPGAGRRPISR